MILYNSDLPENKCVDFNILSNNNNTLKYSKLNYIEKICRTNYDIESNNKCVSDKLKIKNFDSLIEQAIDSRPGKSQNPNITKIDDNQVLSKTNKLVTKSEFICSLSNMDCSNSSNFEITCTKNDNDGINFKYNPSFSFIEEIKISFDIDKTNMGSNEYLIQALKEINKEGFSYSYVFNESSNYEYIGPIFNQTNEDVLNNFIDFDSTQNNYDYLKSNMNKKLNDSTVDISENTVQLKLQSLLYNKLKEILNINLYNKVDLDNSSDGLKIYGREVEGETSSSQYFLSIIPQKCLVYLRTPGSVTLYLKKDSTQSSGYEVHQFSPLVEKLSNIKVNKITSDVFAYSFYINDELVNDGADHDIEIPISSSNGFGKLYLFTNEKTFTE